MIELLEALVCKSGDVKVVAETPHENSLRNCEDHTLIKIRERSPNKARLCNLQSKILSRSQSRTIKSASVFQMSKIWTQFL